jgi:diguanylate cyclase (GGDEF)-like protein
MGQMQSISNSHAILLVEDNQAMRSSLCEMLNATGLKLDVRVATTGKEAIEQYNNNCIDCVMLSYELPDMKAENVLRELQHRMAITKPIIVLTQHNKEGLALNLMAMGASDFISKLECSPSILKRSIAFAVTKQEFINQHNQNAYKELDEKLANVSKEIRYLSEYDSLTKLPNKVSLLNYLDQAISRTSRLHLLGALIYLDLDDYRYINDSYGMANGDSLMVAVAERLQRAIRSNDFIARIGDDEFAIYLDHTKDLSAAGVFAQKLGKILYAPFSVNKDADVYLSASIGICHTCEKLNNSASLLANAQAAVFEVKKSGKNNFAFYSPELTNSTKNRLYLEREIRKALTIDEFDIVYQPKVNAKTGQWMGAEALIRWQHPSDGNIPPDQFIRIAEETDLILQVDSWVLDKVAKQIRYWTNAGLNPPPISVNIPGREFLKNTLLEKIVDVIKQYQLSSEQLVLEVTERLMIDNTDTNISVLQKIKEMGVSISIDDFGTGYSSLNYLVQFPCDELKIDKSFIDNIPHCHESCLVVEAIITLGKNLNKTIVAEGVENEEQIQFLCRRDCDLIQGYYFSKPLTMENFQQQLLDRTGKHKQSEFVQGALRTTHRA